mgnify:CR=1 FL=1
MMCPFAHAGLPSGVSPQARRAAPPPVPNFTANDQKRIVTPSDAVALGADYLVIGRPITGAEDPAEAAMRITDELGT